MTKYALLYAGLYNSLHEDRYIRDISFMYETLIKNGYDNSNIKILFFNGPTIIYKNLNLHTSPGDYNHLEQELISYSNLNYDDQLTIMITNHGGISNGQAVIACCNEPHFPQKYFNDLLKCIPANKLVIHGQCYGGNFIESINKSIIISGNDTNLPTRSTPDNLYDEFLYHFISFFYGKYPDNTPLKISPAHKNITNAILYINQNNTYRNLPPKRVRSGNLIKNNEIACIISTGLNPNNFQL